MPVITVDDPRSADIRALLERHLEFVNTLSPPEDVHALDLAGLLDPSVTLYSARLDGTLLGVGALRQLDACHAELKSMHTSAPARGRGVGRTLLEHLLAVARDRGCTRVSLETGTVPEFGPARALYASAGFRPCPPFADYAPSPNSAFMSLSLAAATEQARFPASG